MALSTTYNVAGDREDLTDFLIILAPEDTPKISTFANTIQYNVYGASAVSIFDSTFDQTFQ